LKIYSTLTNKLEEFKPIEAKKVKIYVCGPTVYNYIHIGNARPVVFFDVVRRYFIHLGYDVQFASNLTDVNDKIYTQSVKEGLTESEIAAKYSDAFLEDVLAVNSLIPDIIPRVTEYIPEISDYVQKLIDKGYAYQSQGDVYFRVTKVKNYGQLSGQKVEDLISGSRVDVNLKKEDPLDFMLWKHNTEGIVYEAGFGDGRPGWHTECSAMIDDIFDGRVDIHGGGIDLRFPHHENELAQTEALHGTPLANVWMHNGRIDLNNAKMSKSSGHMILLRELLKEYDKNAYRLLVLSNSYRAPINFTFELMNSAVKEYEKVFRAVKQLFIELDLTDSFNNELISDSINEMENAMNNDFNTPNVITGLYSLIKKINVAVRSKDVESYGGLYNTINKYLYVLGLDIDFKRMSSEDKVMYSEWLTARKEKNFDKADELRNKLTENGVI